MTIGPQVPAIPLPTTLSTTMPHPSSGEIMVREDSWYSAVLDIDIVDTNQVE